MKKTHKFLIFALILIIIKQILLNVLPIYAIGNGTCDDQLMIVLETNLLQLKWLGDFNSLTFVKGMFFPLFLAIGSFIGISYINFVTILYSLSCLVFIYVIKDMFKNKKILYIIFAILLFNPVTFDFEVIQRVYRNSLTPSQTILIFSSMFYLYKNRNNKTNKKLWLFSILGGISLASFYNTREDAMWIIPMIIVCTTIMLFEHIFKNNKKDNKKIIIFLLPILILFSINNIISSINYYKYGVFTRVDVSDSDFANAIKAIYSVPTNEKIKYTSVTREKLERIYKVSPTLNSIKDSLDRQIITLDKVGRIDDNEIEDGWFWWALRFAAEENGYYENAKKADEFYKKIVLEIKQSQKNGDIEKINTMPSSLMSPWKKGYFIELLSTFTKITIYTNSFKDIGPKNIQSIGSNSQIKLFEIATNNQAIMPNINSKITGWYKYDLEDYNIEIKDINENIYKTFECKKSKICNIEFDINEYNIEDINNMHLNIKTKNEELDNLYFKDNLNSFDSEYKSYHINSYSKVNPASYQKKLTSYYVKRLEIIANIYKTIIPILSIIGIASYIYICIRIFKSKKIIDDFLIITSILLSYIVLCMGVSYNEISSCSSINTLYLSGTYPLIIMFDLLSIFISLKIMKKEIILN